jgi:putative sterol carrier protein
MRVLLIPERATRVETHIAFNFSGHKMSGLHIRNCVAVPTNGVGAEIAVNCTPEIWADIISGDLKLSVAVETNALTVTGDKYRALEALQVFDVENLQL